MDCFASLAMTWIDMTSHSRGAMRPSFAIFTALEKSEGAGKAGCRLAPAVSCAKVQIEAHTSIQVSAKHPAFPAQWFYGLYRALPGDEFVLPPSPANWRCRRPGWIEKHLRRLDTSNGCQDHTALPSASAPFVCAPCPLTDNRPANDFTRLTLSRPPQPAPTFVTTADAPLAEQDGRSFRVDLGCRRSGFFFHAGLDGANRVEAIEEISLYAHVGFCLSGRFAPLPYFP